MAFMLWKLGDKGVLAKANGNWEDLAWHKFMTR
jgi:hypothetical protein